MNIQYRREETSLNFLVRKAQQGDGAAFIELIERNKQTLYKIARSYFSNEEDIADAIQDTIESSYRSIGYLDKTEYFRTWLIRILINKCLDIIKRNKQEHPVEFFPEEGAACLELSQCEFEELMQSLDEKYRTILLLYYGEGFKISEIAQLLDLEENTIKTRLSRGRQKFRAAYETAENVGTN